MQTASLNHLRNPSPATEVQGIATQMAQALGQTAEPPTPAVDPLSTPIPPAPAPVDPSQQLPPAPLQ